MVDVEKLDDTLTPPVLNPELVIPTPPVPLPLPPVSEPVMPVVPLEVVPDPPYSIIKCN